MQKYVEISSLFDVNDIGTDRKMFDVEDVE